MADVKKLTLIFAGIGDEKLEISLDAKRATFREDGEMVVGFAHNASEAIFEELRDILHSLPVKKRRDKTLS